MSVTYFFRFIDDGKPTGHIGLASARTMNELFWEIDQYGDPCAVEIHPVKSGSFCILKTEIDSEDLDDYRVDYDEFEISEYFPDHDSPKWRVPQWATREGLDKLMSQNFGATQSQSRNISVALHLTPIDEEPPSLEELREVLENIWS